MSFYEPDIFMNVGFPLPVVEKTFSFQPSYQQKNSK